MQQRDWGQASVGLVAIVLLVIALVAAYFIRDHKNKEADAFSRELHYQLQIDEICRWQEFEQKQCESLHTYLRETHHDEMAYCIDRYGDDGLDGLRNIVVCLGERGVPIFIQRE
ncbi:MAG TPA: hypothetical protein PKD09_17920 [Aggregatilinea sp.]|uniref:hypothetical protein n=1 Tax=Aggregatilinea sp. TaxID=2806333 RepID=UPI002BDCB900|nr:hypothetical protein [Aggregatilinea sp.]HML23539.1 hypothetical protein [Aggregatilinea sp.]